jgi:beta-lactamase regulating signal transducer with metallopeptidase domain
MTWITRLLSEPTALALALGWALLHFIWQGLVVLLLLLAALRLLRDRSAQARYGIACGALATMMALPLVTLTYLSRATRVQRSSPAVRADADVPGVQSPTQPLASPAEIIIPGRHGPATVVSAVPAARHLGWTPARIEAALPVLTGIWCLGVVALSMRMLRQWIAAQRLKRRDTRKPESTWERRLCELAWRLGIRRTVALLESTRAAVPVVIGWLRPVILVPASALAELTPAQLEAILAHELAHIRRHDYLVNLFQVLVETLLFYHPAVWWVSGRIRVEREHCCDDMAVTFCGDAPLYTRALARLEELRRAAPQMVLAASGGTLLHRIRRLISGRSPCPDRLAGWPAFALVASVIICVGLGVHFTRSVRGAQAKPAPDADAGMFQPIPRTEPTSTVTGLVSDEDGRPVPDAVVQAILRTGDEELGQRRTQRTNSDGRFTFDNLDPPGVWFLTADHPDFAQDWERERGMFVPAQSQEWPLRIKLYRPHSMPGVVVNENGDTVSGVTVTLAREWLPGNSSPVQGWLAFDVQKTTTDREGRFEFKRLRPGKLMLVMEHADYARTLSEQLEVGAEPVRLTIRKGLELHGRVLADAAPLAGVSVKVQAPNLAHRSLGQWEVKTDEHGEFTVRHIVDRFEMNGAGVNTVSVFVDDGAWKSPVYSVFQSGSEHPTEPRYRGAAGRCTGCTAEDGRGRPAGERAARQFAAASRQRHDPRSV